MADYWVLVADESAARLFATDKIRAELSEFEALTNPDARRHESDLVAEGKGRSFDSRGSNRHAMEPQTSARKQAAINFAKTIARQLEQGADNHDYRRLILIAPPEMLGLLRDALGHSAAALLYLTLDKDLVRAKPAEILRHLSG